MEQFETFSKKLEVTDLKRAEEQGKLGQQLEQLMKTSTELDKGARDLSAALKGDNKVAGDWGELVLERVLESAALQEGREYVTQQSERDAEGNYLRPDVVIRLPESKNLVIDATYFNKVNRLFGEDSPQGDYEGDSALLNASYQFKWGKVTGYNYLLDFENIAAVPAAVRDSTNTYGLRYAGEKTAGKVKIGLQASYARQSDHADNPLDFLP